MPLIVILILGSVPFPSVIAQVQAGGVELPGDPSWFAGKGLKQGDFFSYQMCLIDYKECTEFKIDLWVKGDKKSGTDDKRLVNVVVYEGDEIIKGEMELGILDPEPSGGSDKLGVYRDAFKSSIAWLSAFANEHEPKKFSEKSWGTIVRSGEQIIPTLYEKITVPAGSFETFQVSWREGGYKSKVWVAPDMPFPIKAHTYIDVGYGVTLFKFTLLSYKENVQKDPFAGITSDIDNPELKDCPKTDSLTNSIKRPTKNFSYQIHAYYSPEYPVQGCPMKWQFNFLSKYLDTEFLNQVQYDLLVVDDKFTLPAIRSLSKEQGFNYIYSPSGISTIDMIVKEPPGIAHYVVYVYGLAPPELVPTTSPDYLVIDVPILANEKTPLIPKIPAWIKNNAGWWADGSIDDNSFIQGIQFLIKEKIIVIPPTTQGTGSGNNEIPSWIKNNAGWWADGSIDDNSFIQGIQFLIKEGMIKISS
jgi:hypothetical protein